ncbi:MAG TPA: hypothetical protein EYG11_10160 [Candidatus Latescibacteria bacterium]|nr:hypothetical protein [Candidatus Handelsmanbacteria bacterium]HIL09053.1 hypothetical protein [Candidatus Latescibacterota bacterium]
MGQSMFSREVARKLEQEINSFETCRGLSLRARDINIDRKGKEIEGGAEGEGQPNSSASAMLEFTAGSIILAREDIEEEE